MSLTLNVAENLHMISNNMISVEETNFFCWFRYRIFLCEEEVLFIIIQVRDAVFLNKKFNIFLQRKFEWST